MTSLEDINSAFNISSDFSNVSKYADNSLNALLISYNTESFSQNAINNAAAITIRVNVTTAQSEIDNVSQVNAADVNTAAAEDNDKLFLFESIDANKQESTEMNIFE